MFLPYRVIVLLGLNPSAHTFLQSPGGYSPQDVMPGSGGNGEMGSWRLLFIVLCCLIAAVTNDHKHKQALVA